MPWFVEKKVYFENQSLWELKILLLRLLRPQLMVAVAVLGPREFVLRISAGNVREVAIVNFLTLQLRKTTGEEEEKEE